MAKMQTNPHKHSELSVDKADMITAIYVRVSTEAQFEEGYSLEAQIERLKKYCESKNYGNIEVFEDGGWSGSNIDRPALKRLIEAIKMRRVARVLVFKLDRLSRSQKDTLYLIEEVFLPYGVEFCSLNESFDTATSYGKAMIGVLSVFAQLERENIRERTQMGMQERLKKGYWRGGGTAPFGYDYDQENDILVPNADAEKVRQIYDLYLQGFSITKLAKMFGISSDANVTAILDRQTYLGKLVYHGQIYDGLHEAIIDEETWDKVQKERKRRSTKNSQMSRYLLAGFLYCGNCGAKMRYQKWGKGVKLVCYSQQKSRDYLVKDPDCDNTKHWYQDVERFVIEDLFRFADRYVVEDQMLPGKSKKSGGNVEALTRRRDEIAEERKRLYRLLSKEDFADDNELMETLEEKKRELERIDHMLENEKNAVSDVNLVAVRKDVCRNLRHRWDGLTIEEKRRAIRLCIDKIVITGDNIDIYYAY